MKRFILLAAAASIGGIVFSAAPASAHPADPVEQSYYGSEVAAPASDSPPLVLDDLPVLPVQVPAPPLPQVTVMAGDTLSGIGARTHRTWPQLASFNHIANPDLIYPGQVVVIPPATYVPVGIAQPAPLYSPPVTTHSAPTLTYTPRPAPTVSAPVNSGGIWGCIAAHESGGNPSTNTGNGYYGAFQDTLGSWQSAGGGPGLPSDYSYSQQLAVNQRIQQQQGWGAWPTTSRMCGA